MSKIEGAEFLSPTDLAGYLKVPVGTVYQWNYRHEGPPRIRVGRHVRYRVTDVEAWLEAQTDRVGAA